MQSIKHWKPKVSQEISKILSVHSTNTPWNTTLIKYISKLSTKGKYLRSSLFLEVLLLFSNMKQAKQFISIAASIELFHLSLLIHDDIMDNDSLRRGIPTIHSQYTPEEFGKSLAICTGDLGLMIAIGGFASLTTNLHRYAVSEMVNVACGQVQDLHFTYTQNEIQWNQIIQMYINKTSHYTFVFPILLAIKITEQPKELQEIYQKIGLNLGLLFQITDDELSLFGDTKTTGKSPCNDLLKEKKTLYWYLLHQTDLKYIFRNNTLDIHKVQQEIKTSKTFQKIQLFKQEILTESKQLIQKISIGKDLFQEILDFIMNREV